ncbi:MAG: DUF2478 domain-containing protein [Phenylobacterium sp.]|nr:DUF2478 domain-containing protein [Phenylobacterium sp.]
MPIAVVRGAPTPQIQALFASFVARLGATARVVGVVEEAPASGRDQLRSLADGRRFEVFQALGRGSRACSVDAGSIVTACEAVLGDIAAGCDLVVLSKFGRLEAVAPKFDLAWSAFAAPLFVMLPPRLEAVEAWWRGLGRQAA